MSLLYFDTETYSPVPITNGTYAYAEQAEVIMYQYAIDDGTVNVLSATPENTALMANLLSDESYTVVIHNSNFDRTIMRTVYQIDIPTNRIFDTMVCAMAHSLPGSLGQLGDILNIDSDKTKDKRGKALINLFCKPQIKKGKETYRNTHDTHPKEWEEFCEYGKLDIVAMREIYKKLPKWNYRGAEHALWCLDQKINDRGVSVDIELATCAIAAIARAKKEYAEDTVILTNSEVSDTSRRDVLLEHILSEYGIALPDLTSTRVTSLLDERDLHPKLRELLEIRVQSNKVSSSKYKRVLNGVSSDGRLKGLLQFCGAARTGRWSGRLFQPQNLPRPTLSNDDIETGIAGLKANCYDLI